MIQTTQTPAVEIAPEVVAFAAVQGVTSYLSAVVEMTLRLFPSATLRVVVEDDPEIANDRHIVMVGKVQKQSVSEALETRYQWHRGLFACCPAPQVCVFRLGMESGND
jgi:hypothetical protein